VIGYERLRTYAALKAGADRAGLDEFLKAIARDQFATVSEVAGKPLKLTIPPPEYDKADRPDLMDK
jgi:hypothetical protein